MSDILAILDQTINGYYQSKGNYPSKILMSKETKEKIDKALELEPDLSDSWKDTTNNYKGIIIEIKENVFIEMEN